MNNKNPLVAIRCMTFNHAPYILDAMNGFCMQKTSFPFVCAVIDDCSTDGEQEVISNYLHEHFDLEDQSVARYEETDDYKLIYARHKENHNCFFVVLYLKYNHYSIGKKLRKIIYIKEFEKNAKYIALCEGDDYWTDPLKLQKQVDYLENHPECGLIYTDYSVYIQKYQVMIADMIKSGRNLQINSFEEHLEKAAYIVPPSWLYRKNPMIDREVECDENFIDGSFTFALEYFKHSQVHYMDMTTCVYRILDNSASHFTSWKGDYFYHKKVHNQQLFFAEKYRVSEDITYRINYSFYAKYYKSILALNDFDEYSNVKSFLNKFGLQGVVATFLMRYNKLSRMIYTIEKNLRSFIRRDFLK